VTREVSELLARALSLSPKARAALAGSLIESLDGRQPSSRPLDWWEYLAEGPVASPTFMDNVEDIPPPGRKRQL
jgi:hypothetical protein